MYLLSLLRDLLLRIIAAIILAINGGSTPPPPPPTTNHAPTATSATITTDMGVLSTAVTPIVVDPDSGNTHTFTLVTPAANGLASVVANRLTYLPNLAFSGTDSFTFRATDAGGLSVVGTATATVINHAPTAVSASIATDRGIGTPITPTVTDQDIGDIHTYTIELQPSQGTASVMGNQLSYVSNSLFSKSDNFTFRATDAAGLSVVGSAIVTAINHAPTATHAGFAVFSANLSYGGSPSINDPDYWDTFSVSPTSLPANGAVSLVGNKFRYQASSTAFSGSDSFNYTVSDSAGQTVNGTALVRAYNATNYARCTTASTVNTDGTLGVRINVNPCAFYGEVITRIDRNNNPVTVKYVALRPADGSDPKAVVFMIGGGDLNMNITGNASTGASTTVGGNFVVRSSQLLADAGYLVIAMDRPSDRPTAGVIDTFADVDAYRISTDHAVDILAVTRDVNTDHLPLFLSGTSRGAMSVVAQNLIANGIALSGPVTSDLFANRLYVGKPGVANLQPGYVQRPTYVSWHSSDACPLSTPANSLALFNSLNVSKSNSIASGGVRVTTASATVSPDICGAFDYHGYLGIEPTVMSSAARNLNGTYAVLFGAGNHQPDAAFVTITTSANSAKQINLTSLSRDADNDPRSYALSNTTTSLGGTVTLNGSTLTYTPPAGISNSTDYLVYVVNDINQAVTAAVIQIQIGN